MAGRERVWRARAALTEVIATSHIPLPFLSSVAFSPKAGRHVAQMNARRAWIGSSRSPCLSEGLALVARPVLVFPDPFDHCYALSRTLASRPVEWPLVGREGTSHE